MTGVAQATDAPVQDHPSVRRRPWWLGPGALVGALVTYVFAFLAVLNLVRPVTATLHVAAWTSPANVYDGRTFPCGAPAWHSYPPSTSIDPSTFGAPPGDPGYEKLRSTLCSWAVGRPRRHGLIFLGLSVSTAAATVVFHVLPRRRTRAARQGGVGVGGSRTAWLGAMSAVTSLFGWYQAYGYPGRTGEGAAGGINLGLILAVVTIWSWGASDRRAKSRARALAGLAAGVLVLGYLVLVITGVAPQTHQPSE